MPPNGNYDPEVEDKNSTASGDALSSNSTSGAGASFSRGDSLDPVRQSERNGGFRYNPNGDDTAASDGGGTSSTKAADGGAASSTGGSSLADREKAGAEGPGSSSGGLWSPGSTNTTSKHKSKFGLGKFGKKKAALAAGAATGAAVTGAAVFFMLIPLRIETLVKDVENKALQTTENAVQKEDQTLFEKYVVNKVLPGYKKCGSTISRDCSAIPIVGGSDNPVTALYKAWSQTRFENKLATNYGIEFRYHPKAKVWYLSAPGLSAPEDIGADGSKLENVFSSRTAARSAVQSALDNAFEGEARWREAYMRYKIGRLLEEKYGLPRCVVVCKVTDPLHDFVNAQKKSAALYLTQRVVIPRTQVLGIALQCLLTACDPTQTQPNGDPSAPATAGEPEDQQLEKPVSDGIRALAAEYQITDEASIKAIQQAYTDIGDKGLQKWLISQGLQKFGANQATADLTANAVPIAGEINMAAQIVGSADNASNTLKKIRYVINTTEDVNTLTTYKVFASELHLGHDTATEVGSMDKSLGAVDTISTSSTATSAASAQSSPLYQDVIDNKTSISTTGGTTKDFKCNDGKNVPAGSLICPEEALGGGSSIANTIHEFLNLPGVGVITQIANLWNNTVGQVFGIVGGALGSAIQALVAPFNAACNVPVVGTIVTGGYCEAKNLAASASGLIIEGLTNWLIPNQGPYDGGHIFNRMVGGAVAEERDAGAQIGGHTLTSQQVASIDGEQENQAQQQFSQRPFFARMFSTDTQYSLVSRLAMDMPFNLQASAQTTFASILNNPLSMVAHSFGSIFSKASAATGASDADMFKAMDVNAIGLTDGDVAAVAGQDQSDYWSQNCNSDESQGFQNGNAYNVSASQKTDPKTGMPEYDTIDYCKLIQTSVCTLGATIDTSTCAPDDVADVNGAGGTTASSGTPPASGGGTTATAGATIDMAHLYDDSSSIACAPNTNDLGVYDGYTSGNAVKIRLCAISNLPSTGSEANGGFGVKNAGGKCPLNSRVSGAVYAMVQAAQKDGVTLTTDSCFRTMSHQQQLWVQYGENPVRVAKPGTSNHQMGLAMDFVGAGSGPAPGSGQIWDWLTKNASNFGYKNYPAEAWHWSPTGN